MCLYIDLQKFTLGGASLELCTCTLSSVSRTVRRHMLAGARLPTHLSWMPSEPKATMLLRFRPVTVVYNSPIITHKRSRIDSVELTVTKQSKRMEPTAMCWYDVTHPEHPGCHQFSLANYELSPAHPTCSICQWCDCKASA